MTKAKTYLDAKWLSNLKPTIYEMQSSSNNMLHPPLPQKISPKRPFTPLYNYYYYTCESAQVLDSEGCNTAGQILVQHIEGMAPSPSLTELKEI